MDYRGYIITFEYDLNHHAVDPNADYDCDQDGYFQCSGMPHHEGKTVQDCKDEVDNYWAEAALDICQALSGWANMDYMEWYGLDYAWVNDRP